MICPNCNTDSSPSLFCYVCDAYLPSQSQGVKASIPSRLGAFLLDELVFFAVLIVVGVIAYFAGAHVGGSFEDYDPETILIILCAAALSYFLLFLWFLARGQTPGKWLVDIRAVDKRNGSEPGLGRMLLRETLGKWVSGCFFGVGWFWAIWDRDAQAWHDKIARTVVLYRPCQSSKYLAFLLLFGVPLLSVGFLWASLITRTRPHTGAEGVAMLSTVGNARPSPEAAAVRVPFVGCRSDGQTGPVPAPMGADRFLAIEAHAAQELAYYQAGVGVLAPHGWYCFGTYGSNASNLFITPQPIKGDDLFSASWGGFTGPVIQVSDISGDTSGRFEVARVIARLFPEQKAFVQRVINEGIEPPSDFPFGAYPEDTLTFQSDRIVEYRTPALSKGLGTDSSLRANPYPIYGVAILEGQTPDVLVLNVRLSPKMSDLTSPIIHQFENDHAEKVSKQTGTFNNEPQSQSAFIQQAADQGEAHAQYELGMIYHSGQGVSQDDAQAAIWWRKAAEQGNANAQRNLGRAYYLGQGVLQDYGEAYFWLGLAASGKTEDVNQDELQEDVHDAASHLTPEVVSQVQARVRKWLEERPTKTE